MAKQSDAKESWWNGDSAKIYTSHLLSSWGDRMWAFAVGLYLIILYPKSLQVKEALEDKLLGGVDVMFL